MIISYLPARRKPLVLSVKYEELSCSDNKLSEHNISRYSPITAAFQLSDIGKKHLFPIVFYRKRKTAIHRRSYKIGNIMQNTLYNAVSRW